MLLKKCANYTNEVYPYSSTSGAITTLTTEMQNYLNLVKDLDNAYGFDLDVDNQEVYYLDNNGDEMSESRITVNDLINIIRPK